MKTLLLLGLLTTLVVAQNPIAQAILAAMNQTVDPCQDFYEFSCGTWIATTPMPGDQTRFDKSFSTIEKFNHQILLQILQNPTQYSQKLSDLFNGCLNTTLIDSLGWEPVDDLWVLGAEIDNIKDLFYVVGRLHASGVAAPLFSLSTVIDSGNPTINIGDFGQSGLALPYPALYSANDTNSIELRKQYLQHVTNMFALINDPNPPASAQNVIDFETIIASITVDPDELLNPFTVYNKLNVTGLAEITPNIPWEMYFMGLGFDFEQATVDVPAYFANLSSVIESTSSYWNSYIEWQVIHSMAPYLSSPFVKENFNFFGQILNGQKEPTPRSDFCIEVVDGSLGELLGKFFESLAFNGDSIQLAQQLLQGIEDAMKTNLENLDWMDSTTRQRALEKLSLVSNMIAGPTNPDDYADVNIDVTQFVWSIRNAMAYITQKQLSLIEQPAVKTAWGMTSDTVNAYYDPTRNQMVFPAGIMQQPFFNASFPPAMNAGGIGMVMGHELTHGFDDEGRDYDGTGRLTNWWENSTSVEFDARVQCVIKQYSQFEVIPGVFVNGKLTQGENIADMGGIKNTFHSFLKSNAATANETSIVPGFTNAQLLFISFAQGWCEIATDEALRNQVQTNPHSPAKFRVLGPLINLPEFAETFSCPSGSYMNPTQRCQVW
eukprot:TRINITY_DN3848_c0_g1_i1.p1 TRINITY_DN3848_c0_g1~~TRINITY_DN3848_c0_g1_i1.p1  ORF type:complete len:669 (-),score=183.66 TRINITY_DN3848_c0_g1_i1:1-1983(-)